MLLRIPEILKSVPGPACVHGIHDSTCYASQPVTDRLQQSISQQSCRHACINKFVVFSSMVALPSPTSATVLQQERDCALLGWQACLRRACLLTTFRVGVMPLYDKLHDCRRVS